MSSTPDLPPLPSTPTRNPPVEPHQATPTDASNLPATTPEKGTQPQLKPASGHVGPYQLLGELDRGGMGVVYKARHVVLDRIVALKMMQAGARAEPQDAQRFEREMRAMARLNHPNILTIYEIGWHDNQPYYTMPYVASGSLAAQRERLPSEPAAIAALLAKVARAVHCAHEQGIVHRDLKPGNVLLDERGEPLVTDFGLAKLLDDKVELTQTGAVLGTPAYVAPEQASGQSECIGPPTDVWALGVMLYELLLGRRPFLGANGEAVKERIRTANPPPPRTLRSNLHPALESIVLKCLAKPIAQRYATAAELADDLERYVRGDSPRAHDERRRLWRRLRANLAATIVVVLCLAAVLGLAIVGLSHRFGKLPEPVPIEAEQTPAEPEQPLPEPITLLDGGTPPPRRQWIAGEAGATVLAMPPKGLFTFSSRELNLLVLRSAPPWSHYRLEAEIEDKSEGRFANVGVFFALTHHRSADEVYYTFWELGFAEKGRSPRYDRTARLDVCRLQDAPGLFQKGGQFPRATHRFDPLLADPKTRRLAIEVTEQEVRAFGGDKQFRTAKWDELDQRNQGMVDDLQDVKAPFNPHGALGIFVRQGTAVFHRVALSPLR